jgi:hypothetical protein
MNHGTISLTSVSKTREVSGVRGMILLDIMMALIVAIILSAIFALSTWRGNKKSGFIWLFLIIFIATWAGGIWLRPFGPKLWGLHWLSFLLIGFLVALFLSLKTPSNHPPRGRRETLDMLERIKQEKEIQKMTYVTINLFFWVLLAALVAAIILRYVFVIG